MLVKSCRRFLPPLETVKGCMWSKRQRFHGASRVECGKRSNAFDHLALRAAMNWSAQPIVSCHTSSLHCTVCVCVLGFDTSLHCTVCVCVRVRARACVRACAYGYAWEHGCVHGCVGMTRAEK